MFKRIQKAVAPLLTQMHLHPFNTGLFKGSLPKETFYFFLLQDRFYLRSLAGILNKTSHQLEQPKHQRLMSDLAVYIAHSELKLHQKYLSSPTPFFSKKIPVNCSYPHICVINYVRHINLCLDKNPSVATASILPCFFLYSELGQRLLSQGLCSKNPYSSWLKSYGSLTFLNYKNLLATCVDELASANPIQVQEEMFKASLESARLELQLWDTVIDFNAVSSAQEPFIYKYSA